MPEKYTKNFLYLRSDDINFSAKDVTWSIGLGGTVFALKEMGAGIRFNPWLWENGCHQSVQVIYKKGNVHNLNQSNRILIFNTGYSSPLLLRLLYGHDLRKLVIQESHDKDKSIANLKSGKVDVILSLVSHLYSKQGKVDIPILELRNTSLESEIIPTIPIPCRAMFYSHKLQVTDKVIIEKILTSFPWKNEKYKLKEFIPIDANKFKNTMDQFNWELDEKIRRKIKKL